MELSEKFDVPEQLTLLYDFANSIDLREYLEKGTFHVPGDELGTMDQFERWMRNHKLLSRNENLSPADHKRALDLRSAIRSYLETTPNERRAKDRRSALKFNQASQAYPLEVEITPSGSITLHPNAEANGIGLVLAQFFTLADTGNLDRLKMCTSDECHWVFFDRSKPSNRRWCSSSLCGNRQKTRAYRDRRRNNNS
jgi:predicted RNA-binding Zn ribbon-like protein